MRTLPLAAAVLLTGAAPARALVPYVYLPPTREMQAAGLGIAQAAARLLRLGQADDAARLAELTVRLLPEDPRGWVLLAEAQLRSNNLDQAQVALERAKRLDPSNPGIWFAEGSLALRNGRPSEALSLQMVFHLDRASPDGHACDQGSSPSCSLLPLALALARSTAVLRAGSASRRVVVARSFGPHSCSFWKDSTT